MGTRDKRIDAYIAKSADFAQPILRYLREVIHEGCPQVQETIKWSMPFFDYDGAILCNVAAFKQHCALNFWRSPVGNDKVAGAMGQFGRVTSLDDLPPKKELIGYVKEAMRLRDAGVKSSMAGRKKAAKKPLTVPAYFTGALKKNKKAFANYEAFPPSKKRDYVEWVTEAKTEETRVKRLKTSVEWMSEGKARNWKYEKC